MGEAFSMEEVFSRDVAAVCERATTLFDSLKDFLYSGEQYVAKEYANYVDWHQEHQKRQPWLMDWELSDGYLDRWLEGLAERGHGFPRFLYYSFVILACSLFEDSMRMVSRAFVNLGLVEAGWDSLRGAPLVRAKKLLNRTGMRLRGEEELLRKLQDHYMVRNCVVHHSGVVRQASRLAVHAMESDILSEGHEEPILELSGEYCREVGDAFEMFFLELSIRWFARKRGEENSRGD